MVRYPFHSFRKLEEEERRKGFFTGKASLKGNLLNRLLIKVAHHFTQNLNVHFNYRLYIYRLSIVRYIRTLISKNVFSAKFGRGIKKQVIFKDIWRAKYPTACSKMLSYEIFPKKDLSFIEIKSYLIFPILSYVKFSTLSFIFT